MNLSGPATGLEMMQPVGLTAPTPNFFARKAYYVNKMVIGKTSAELLAEFTRRMDASSRKAGRGRVRRSVRRGAAGEAALALSGRAGQIPVERCRFAPDINRRRF